MVEGGKLKEAFQRVRNDITQLNRKTANVGDISNSLDALEKRFKALEGLDSDLKNVSKRIVDKEYVSSSISDVRSDYEKDILRERKALDKEFAKLSKLIGKESSRREDLGYRFDSLKSEISSYAEKLSEKYAKSVSSELPGLVNERFSKQDSDINNKFSKIKKGIDEDIEKKKSEIDNKLLKAHRDFDKLSSKMDSYREKTAGRISTYEKSLKKIDDGSSLEISSLKKSLMKFVDDIESRFEYSGSEHEKKLEMLRENVKILDKMGIEDRAALKKLFVSLEKDLEKDNKVFSKKIEKLQGDINSLSKDEIAELRQKLKDNNESLNDHFESRLMEYKGENGKKLEQFSEAVKERIVESENQIDSLGKLIEEFDVRSISGKKEIEKRFLGVKKFFDEFDLKLSDVENGNKGALLKQSKNVKKHLEEFDTKLGKQNENIRSNFFDFDEKFARLELDNESRKRELRRLSDDVKISLTKNEKVIEKQKKKIHELEKKFLKREFGDPRLLEVKTTLFYMFVGILAFAIIMWLYLKQNPFMMPGLLSKLGTTVVFLVAFLIVIFLPYKQIFKSIKDLRGRIVHSYNKSFPEKKHVAKTVGKKIVAEKSHKGKPYGTWFPWVMLVVFVLLFFLMSNINVLRFDDQGNKILAQEEVLLEQVIADNIPHFAWNKNTDKVIDLNDYFSDPEGGLKFSVSKLENIHAVLDEYLLTLTPSEDWHGSGKIVITAIDGNLTTSSPDIYLIVRDKISIDWQNIFRWVFVGLIVIALLVYLYFRMKPAVTVKQNLNEKSIKNVKKEDSPIQFKVLQVIFQLTLFCFLMIIIFKDFSYFESFSIAPMAWIVIVLGVLSVIFPANLSSKWNTIIITILTIVAAALIFVKTENLGWIRYIASLVGAVLVVVFANVMYGD